MKKGEIIEDVYYTMEKYSYLMADIDLSMSMRWEKSAAYIAGDLDHNDAAPKGKRRTSSLREMEKKIQADRFRADCNKWRKYDSAGTG